MTRPSFVVEDARIVIDAILAYQREHNGVSPTVRELAAACYMSPTAMHYRLEMLEARGYIEHKPGKMRTLKVIPPEERT